MMTFVSYTDAFVTWTTVTEFALKVNEEVVTVPGPSYAYALARGVPESPATTTETDCFDVNVWFDTGAKHVTDEALIQVLATQAVPPIKTVGKLLADPKLTPVTVIVANPIRGPFAGLIP